MDMFDLKWQLRKSIVTAWRSTCLRGAVLGVVIGLAVVQTIFADTFVTIITGIIMSLVLAGGYWFIERRQ